MAMDNLDDLTVHWADEDGQVLVNELEKRIVQRGSWATVLFRYEERDRKTGEMQGPKFALRRYRKRGDRYEVHAKFVLTSPEQAHDVAATLLEWTANGT